MQENILKLLLVFLVISCNYQSDESLKIRVKVIDYRTEEGQKNVLVEMGEMKKPIFRMWYYHKVVESYTDSKGEVIFTIKKNKNYQFVAKDEKLKNYGYMEYNSNTDSVGNTVIIRYKKTSLNY